MNKQNILSKKTGKVSNDTSFSPSEIHGMIEKEAYDCAAARGFQQGNALDDWLTAERRVNKLVKK